MKIIQEGKRTEVQKGGLLSSKRVAFTLTEVLLAAVIVGVISALVIPAIVTHYQGKNFQLAQKRVVQAVSNSVDTLVVNENTDFFKTYMYSDEAPESYDDYSGKFLKKYFKISKFCSDNGKLCFAQLYYEFKDKDKKVYTPDLTGSCAKLKDGVSICIKPQISATPIQGIMDLNGEKGPNIFGRDLVTFELPVKTRLGFDTTTSDVIVHKYTNILPEEDECPNAPTNKNDAYGIKCCPDPRYSSLSICSSENSGGGKEQNACEVDPNGLSCCQTKSPNEIFADEVCCTYDTIKNSNTNCGQEMRVTVEVNDNKVKMTGLIEGLGVHIGVYGCSMGSFIHLYNNGINSCPGNGLESINLMNSDNKNVHVYSMPGGTAYSQYGSDTILNGNALRFCGTKHMNPCTMAFIVTKNKNFPYIKFVRTEDTSVFND